MVAMEDVPAPLRLSFYLGDVVRNDNHAELESAVLYRTFVAAGLSSEQVQRDFGRLIPQIRKLCRDKRVPTTPYANIATQALSFVGDQDEAHREGHCAR